MKYVRIIFFFLSVFLMPFSYSCKTTENKGTATSITPQQEAGKGNSESSQATTTEASNEPVTSVPVTAEPEPEIDDFEPGGCKTAPLGMACIRGGKVYIKEKKGEEEFKEVVKVKTYYLDKKEISNSDYNLCVRNGRCDRISSKVSSTLKGPTQPAILNWNQAFEYCRWQGKRLPTETEWEKAAQVDEDALYPWGEDEPSCEKANFRTCAAKTLPVGSKPANQNGIYDLGGNASEWVNDWSSKCRLGSCTLKCGESCTGLDPLGPCSGKNPCKGLEFKIAKGGNYLSKPDTLTINSRQSIKVGDAKYTSARCASTHNYTYKGPAWMVKKPLPKHPVPIKPSPEMVKIMHDLVTDTLDKPLCDKPYTSPAHCRDPVSYVKGNESRHQLFMPYVKNLGGGYVGVAADGNYSFIAHARSQWVWLMDFDININRLHKFIKAFVKANSNRRGFVKIFEYRNRNRAKAIIEKEYKGDPEAEFIYGVYKRYRGELYPYYNAKLRPSSRLGKFGWLRNDENYGYIRALFLQDRVAIVPGDLLKDKSLRSIGNAARKMGVPIRMYYPSNAEEFWKYSDNYKKNVINLPFDEASVALRTVHEYPWHPKMRGFAGFWHYVVHGGLAYQEYMKRPDFRYMNDWKAYRIIPTRYRDFSTIHLPNQIPERLRKSEDTGSMN